MGENEKKPENRTTRTQSTHMTDPMAKHNNAHKKAEHEEGRGWGGTHKGRTQRSDRVTVTKECKG